MKQQMTGSKVAAFNRPFLLKIVSCFMRLSAGSLNGSIVPRRVGVNETGAPAGYGKTRPMRYNRGQTAGES